MLIKLKGSHHAGRLANFTDAGEERIVVHICLASKLLHHKRLRLTFQGWVRKNLVDDSVGEEAKAIGKQVGIGLVNR